MFWYKQSLGMKPVLVSTHYKYRIHGEFQSSNRFRMEVDEGNCNLHIQNASLSDSAVYHCVREYIHQSEFLESITVFVQSSKRTAEVLQTQLVDIDRGESVSLNCSIQNGSCNGAHSVYWFKKSEESTAGVIYSRGNSSDQCEKSTDSPTNSCFYNLHIHNVSSDQTGTYYCAVAACGQVLFGNGTRLRIREVSEMLVYVLSGVSVFSTSLVVGLSFCLCTNNNTDRSLKGAAAKTKDVPKRLQYKATEQVNRRRQSHDTWSECVYFSVEQ
uniref:Ig-like domain-containing protein n=1 Tax=Knipowitschia caucasica TaxID=637954 RepID=A0AAV2KN94_KNICA